MKGFRILFNNCNFKRDFRYVAAATFLTSTTISNCEKVHCTTLLPCLRIFVYIPSAYMHILFWNIEVKFWESKSYLCSESRGKAMSWSWVIAHLHWCHKLTVRWTYYYNFQDIWPYAWIAWVSCSRICRFFEWLYIRRSALQPIQENSRVINRWGATCGWLR